MVPSKVYEYSAPSNVADLLPTTKSPFSPVYVVVTFASSTVNLLGSLLSTICLSNSFLNLLIIYLIIIMDILILLF